MGWVAIFSGREPARVRQKGTRKRAVKEIGCEFNLQRRWRWWFSGPA